MKVNNARSPADQRKRDALCREYVFSVALALSIWPVVALDLQSDEGYRFKPVQAQGKPGLAANKNGAFSQVPAAHAGIVFSNSLPAELMMGNYNFMNGSGLAAGDFDGDGWCE